MQTNVKSRFAFHHQNEALLFQFLLHESLSAHNILRQKPSPLLLCQVIGPIDRENVWQSMLGHLPRLRHYCSLFIKYFDEGASPLSQQLHDTLERAQKVARKCSLFQEKSLDEQKMLYRPLKKELVNVIKLLLQKVYDYKENPSILLFLLRHQEECRTVFRKPIVKDLFSDIFPDGRDQAYAFLSEKFSQKGFEHLIPSIETYLKQLRF